MHLCDSCGEPLTDGMREIKMKDLRNLESPSGPSVSGRVNVRVCLTVKCFSAYMENLVDKMYDDERSAATGQAVQ